MCVRIIVHNCCTQYSTEQFGLFFLLTSRQLSQLRCCLLVERGLSWRFKRTVNDELNEVRRGSGDVLERAWVDAGVRPLDAEQHHVISGDGHVTGRSELAAIFEPGERGFRCGASLAEHVDVVALVMHDHVWRYVDEHRRRYTAPN